MTLFVPKFKVGVLVPVPASYWDRCSAMSYVGVKPSQRYQPEIKCVGSIYDASLMEYETAQEPSKVDLYQGTLLIDYPKVKSS